MRGYFLTIWSFVDPIYYKCSRLTYLPAIEKNMNIFRVRLTKYKGKNIQLEDGTSITKNDTLIKIHLHNLRLLKEVKDEKSELKKAKMIYRHVQHSLPGIALYIQNHYKSNQIKGIIGITNLNKSCERLGFEVFNISNPLYKWLKWTTSLPITILARNEAFKKMFYYQPSYLIMSKEKLSKLYNISKGDY